MRTVTISLPSDAAAKLDELARREYRRPRQQALVLLIDAIARAGHAERATDGNRDDARR